MQQKNDGNDKQGNGGRGSASGRKSTHLKQKHVGDETFNPLPDEDYSSRQPPDDSTEASPQGESSVD